MLPLGGAFLAQKNPDQRFAPIGAEGRKKVWARQFISPLHPFVLRKSGCSQLLLLHG
jgi:hypothetical protein